ncbi:hypothetical protein Zmor_024920 [Zophobas morio]|uniref:Uncharacterized protein n=1 Tax=Zophobas morio TaxID=2755281 RepID=A0AA38HR97_9CUCU|nr:hypothetical protein Zmor_024920 [Zophobas morio]
MAPADKASSRTQRPIFTTQNTGMPRIPRLVGESSAHVSSLTLRIATHSNDTNFIKRVFPYMAALFAIGKYGSVDTFRIFRQIFKRRTQEGIVGPPACAQTDGSRDERPTGRGGSCREA